MSKEIKDLQDAVAALTVRIADLEPKIRNLNNASREFTTIIGSTDSLFKSMYESVIGIEKNLFKFSTNLSAQYQLGEKLAKAFKQTSVNIGIGYQNQKLLGKEFNRSVMLVEKLGGDMTDVNAIYTRFAENSGRVRILDDEEVQRIFAIEQATGLMGDSATALAERFDLMGVGSEQFAENINQILNDSQKLGLNSSKVIKVLSDNFESMQRMSFRGGVNAMGEMSKLAVKMRMDVSDMLGMADKFYEPEAAIEAAANLQLLGGKMASTFGDPMQMMFDARNAPEEFAKKVGDATEGMVQFNEKTGKFDIIAENRQRLMGMAEALGINKDQLIDTAFQMNKMKKIKMDVGGNLFDEDTMDKIASIAKFDKDSGSWTVDVKGEDIAVEDLNADQIEKALASPTTEKDAIIETAKASMTTNEHLSAIQKSVSTGIVIETDLYSGVEKQMDQQIQILNEANSEMVTKFAEATKILAGGLNLDGFGDKLAATTSGITEKSLKDITTAITNSPLISQATLQNMNIQSVTFPADFYDKFAAVLKGKATKDGYFPAQGGSKGPTISTTFGGLYQIDPRDAIAVGPPSAIPTPNTSMEQKYISNSTSPTTNSNINMGGNVTMTVKVDAPSGVDTKIIEKAVNKAFTTNRLEELVTGKVSGKDNVYSNTF